MSVFEKRLLKKESYDDKVVKQGVIELAPNLPILGFELIENDNPEDWVMKKGLLTNIGIDLKKKGDSTIGVEVERGGWVHNFWDDGFYEIVLEYGFPTLNMPDRKEKYWEEFCDWFKNGEIKHNLSFNKNIFVRTNYFLTQVIVVLPDVIRDPSKVYRKRHKVTNNGYPENWLSWKREHVLTYNKINGMWILDTEENGQLPLITAEEKKQLELRRDREKSQVKRDEVKNRLQSIKESKEK